MDPLRIPSKSTAHSNKLSIFARVWPSMVAGLAGSVAHSSLMFLKYRAGLLPSFQPYDDLQRALSDLFGTSVHPAVSWVLSFANGALILGFLFARTYRLLPGQNGAVKGLVFGLLGWIAMGLFFFPLLGRGLFATQAGLGLLPSVFSLLMVLTYSITLGIVYSVLRPKRSSRILKKNSARSRVYEERWGGSHRA